MPRTGAGGYDRQLVFSRNTPTLDPAGTGELIPGWATVLLTRGAFDPLAVREAFAAGQQGALVDATFRIRYRTDVVIGAKDRVTFDGRVYDILGVHEGRERRKELEILATARNE